MFQFTIYSYLLVITAILISSFDAVVFFGSQSLSSRIFAIFSFLVAIWSSTYGLMLASLQSYTPLFLIRLDHFLGILISLGFFYFSLVYPRDKKPKSYVVFLLTLPGVAVLISSFFTNQIIIDVYPLKNLLGWGWHVGNLYFLYALLFFMLWIAVLTNLWKNISQSQNKTEKLNQYFMFWGLMLGIIPPGVLDIILPGLGKPELGWLGPVGSAIWVYIIGYSIIKYRQLDVRAVLTEVLGIAMAAIFFTNIFIDIPFGVWGRVATFIAFLILAYYLIRSALQESRQKEELASLNLHLSEKVAEQTIEIRKSYDLEKKARRELEKLNETKDQFIMITQHHLRTPVTTIRWGLEEALKGTYGTVKPQLKKALVDTQTATNRLQRIVDDFLSITALKIGSQILNISPSSMLPLLEDVLSELHLDIEQKRIETSYPTDPASWPELPIDAPKLREVILIVIENAIRYNIERGSIRISTMTKGELFEVAIENSGIGLTGEEKEKLFTSLFYRGDAARSAHPNGMGVGLSVSRAIVRAHQGELTITSNGKGTGAEARISIPFKRKQRD